MVQLATRTAEAPSRSCGWWEVGWRERLRNGRSYGGAVGGFCGPDAEVLGGSGHGRRGRAGTPRGGGVVVLAVKKQRIGRLRESLHHDYVDVVRAPLFRDLARVHTACSAARLFSETCTEIQRWDSLLPTYSGGYAPCTPGAAVAPLDCGVAYSSQRSRGCLRDAA